MKASKLIFYCLLLLLSIFFKVIPHLPNFSPQLVFVLYLGTVFSGMQLFWCVLIMTLGADCVGSWVFDYSLFGSWVWFTYSAYFLIAILSNQCNCSVKKLIFLGAAFMSAVGFWLWSNFGTWLFSGLYAHNFNGFWQCYILALPFLRVSLMGTLLWASGFFILFRYSVPKSFCIFSRIAK